MNFRQFCQKFRLDLVFAVAIFVFILVGILIIRSPSPFGFQSSKIHVNTVPTVKVVEARYQDRFKVDKQFYGRVEARQQSVLGFELRGLLQEIFVDEGDPVEKRQMLAKLDTERLEADLKEAKATLKQSIAEAELAKSTFQRNKEALAVNAVSAQELDVAKEGMESAAAKVNIHEARVERIEVDLKKSTLVSPYEGVVVRRYVDEGVVVGPGEQILKIQQRGPLDIRIGVTSEAAKTLSVGETHTLLINNTNVPAEIFAILPVVGESRTVEVIFKADRAYETIRPGDLARLTLEETVSKRGFWVPISALTEGRRGLWTVYAVENQEKGPTLSRRQVELLHIEPSRAYVRGSVDDGEKVVTGGTQKLVPGLNVRIITQKPAYERSR